MIKEVFSSWEWKLLKPFRPCDNWISMWKRRKLYAYLTLSTKINSKLVRELNISSKIIKLLGENIDVIFYDLTLGDGFLDTTPKAQTPKENK